MCAEDAAGGLEVRPAVQSAAVGAETKSEKIERDQEQQTDEKNGG
jgi:hypothetical protein